MASGTLADIARNGVVSYGLRVIDTSVFEYANDNSLPDLSFVVTAGGTPDNPQSTGSFLNLVWRRSSGRVIISTPIDSIHLYKTMSSDNGHTFSAWHVCNFS